MGFLKEAAEHGMKIDLKWFILIWSSILGGGLLLDYFFGWDILLRLFQIALGRP